MAKGVYSCGKSNCYILRRLLFKAIISIHGMGVGKLDIKLCTHAGSFDLEVLLWYNPR